MNNKIKEIELSIAKEYGLKRCRGSGNTWTHKSDAQGRLFQFEIKYTGKEVVLRTCWINKLLREVNNTHRIPVLILVNPSERYYLIRRIDCLAFGNEYFEKSTNVKAMMYELGDKKSMRITDSGGKIHYKNFYWLVLNKVDFDIIFDTINVCGRRDI